MRTPFSKPMIGVAAVVLVAAAATGYYSRHRHDVPAVVATAPTVPPTVAEPRRSNPLPDRPAAATDAPLPSLDDSDASVLAALDDVAGSQMVADFVLTPNVVRRIVVTVDNLPRIKAPVEKRPIVSPQGSFLVVGDELHATIDEQNAARYQPFMAALRNLDMARLATVYLRDYPLFQRAYEDLGYPTGYFNDRLVQAIDSLLQTPEVSEPIDLVRPNVMYQFADTKLESLPAGEKILLRLGAADAAVVKAKLRQLRRAVAAP